MSWDVTVSASGRAVRVNGQQLRFSAVGHRSMAAWLKRLANTRGVWIVRRTKDAAPLEIGQARADLAEALRVALGGWKGQQFAAVVVPGDASEVDTLARALAAALPADAGVWRERQPRTLSVRLSPPQHRQVVERAAAKHGKGSPVSRYVRERVLGQSSAARPCSEPEACAVAIEGGTCTVAAALRVPAARGGAGTESIPARYCLIEIDQLLTSHDPLHGFEPRPGYPAEAQERDYRQTVERYKVEEIARSFDPALVFNTSPGAIDGPPVVNEERVVLGGNGRTMATRLVYAGAGGVDADTPQRFLMEHAAEFGLEADQVERMTRPMLVRTIRVGNDPKTLASWSRRLNTPLSAQLDPTRLAVSRARFVSEAAMRELAGSIGEDETLAAFLASERSRAFVRALQTSGVIDGRAMAAYLTPTGLLNDAGRDLVADLLLAVLLPDAELLTAYGKGPVATLARSAPVLVQAGQAGSAYDLRDPLRAAVRDRITMRSQNFERVEDMQRQAGLFGTGAATASDERGTILLHVLSQLELAPAKFARFAKRYAQLAAPGAAGQGALFATEARSPVDALREAAEHAGVSLPKPRRANPAGRKRSAEEEKKARDFRQTGVEWVTVDVQRVRLEGRVVEAKVVDGVASVRVEGLRSWWPLDRCTAGPTTEEFAQRVQRLADAVPENDPGRPFRGAKVFLETVRRQYVNAHAVYASPEFFKGRILEAHKKRLIRLSRLDLVEALSDEQRRLNLEGAVHLFNAEFNVIRSREPV